MIFLYINKLIKHTPHPTPHTPHILISIFNGFILFFTNPKNTIIIYFTNYYTCLI